MKQNKHVNLQNDLYLGNKSAKVLKVVSSGCLGNIKALNLKYVSHWIFFMTIDKIVRNCSKNTEELRRKPCKTHVSWLLIDPRVLFFGIK